MRDVGVLVREEGSQWVAFCVEEFIAAQGATIDEALSELMTAFDVRDQLTKDPAPPAPIDLQNAYCLATHLFDMTLSEHRRAYVRQG